MALVTIKFNPAFLHSSDPMLRRKALFIVGPASLTSDTPYPYNNGVYGERNQAILKRLGCPASHNPVWATVDEGMWITDEELKDIMKTDSKHGMLTSLRSGKIIIRNEDTKTNYTSADLENMR